MAIEAKLLSIHVASLLCRIGFVVVWLHKSKKSCVRIEVNRQSLLKTAKQPWVVKETTSYVSPLTVIDNNNQVEGNDVK